MNAIRGRCHRLARVLFVVSISFLILGTSPSANAQVGGGMSRGGGGKKPKKGPKPKRPEPPRTDLPGHQKGKILKFKPAKENEKDEDLLGVLSVKAFEKGSKSIKMNVRRVDDLQVRVGDHVFDLEEDLDVFWKGLHCTANWAIADPDARKKVKELRTLSFDTIEVTGKIYEIKDELIVIKGVPKNGLDWPDSKAKIEKNDKPKRIRLRKLKLKPLEDISKFYDAENEEADLEEFEEDQEVVATVVLGKPGMIIAIRHPDAKTEDTGRGGRPGPGRRGDLRG